MLVFFTLAPFLAPAACVFCFFDAELRACVPPLDAADVVLLLFFAAEAVFVLAEAEPFDALFFPDAPARFPLLFVSISKFASSRLRFSALLFKIHHSMCLCRLFPASYYGRKSHEHIFHYKESACRNQPVWVNSTGGYFDILSIYICQSLILKDQAHRTCPCFRGSPGSRFQSPVH